MTVSTSGLCARGTAIKALIVPTLFAESNPDVCQASTDSHVQVCSVVTLCALGWVIYVQLSQRCMHVYKQMLAFIPCSPLIVPIIQFNAIRMNLL